LVGVRVRVRVGVRVRVSVTVRVRVCVRARARVSVEWPDHAQNVLGHRRYLVRVT